MSGELTEHLDDARTALLILGDRGLEEEKWHEVEQAVSEADRALDAADTQAFRIASARLEHLASTLMSRTPLGSTPRAEVTGQTREQINRLVDKIDVRLTEKK